MDKVTQSNAANADENAAARLTAQAESLKEALADLLRLVNGQSHQAATSASVASASHKGGAKGTIAKQHKPVVAAAHRSFILASHFRQVASAQQQRSHPRRRESPAFAHDNESAGIANLQLITGLDPCRLTCAIRPPREEISLVPNWRSGRPAQAPE
jgi:hypothetical protein